MLATLESPILLRASAPLFNADVDAVAAAMFVVVGLRDAGGLAGPAFECDLLRTMRKDRGEGIELEERSGKRSEGELRSDGSAELECSRLCCLDVLGNAVACKLARLLLLDEVEVVQGEPWSDRGPRASLQRLI